MTTLTVESDAGPAAREAAASPWRGLVVVATAQLMIALDATVVNIALPSAQAALGFSDVNRQWIVTAYTLAFGGLLFIGGRIADSARMGRRRALLIGLIGFAAASALSGGANSLGMLVGARALQGAFAALLAPTALSTLAVMFTHPGERARAFGIYGAIAASGGAIGLLLGGALTQYLDWRWCLYINVPIALIAALGARAFLPAPADHTRISRDHVTVDVTPAAYAGGWRAGVGGPVTRLAAIVGDRERGAAYISGLLAVAGMFGAFLFLTYELQVVLGFTPLQAGVAFLPMTVASFLAGTQIAPRLLARVSPAVFMAFGFLLAAAGMAVLSRLTSSSGYVTGILPAEILLGLGVASVMMPASILATSRVEPHSAGLASATLNTAQQLGASFGTTVLNTVAASATAVYLASSVSASRPDALVHGYATAAIWATTFLLVGAGVAAISAVASGSRS